MGLFSIEFKEKVDALNARKARHAEANLLSASMARCAEQMCHRLGSGSDRDQHSPRPPHAIIIDTVTGQSPTFKPRSPGPTVTVTAYPSRHAALPVQPFPGGCGGDQGGIKAAAAGSRCRGGHACHLF